MFPDWTSWWSARHTSSLSSLFLSQFSIEDISSSSFRYFIGMKYQRPTKIFERVFFFPTSRRETRSFSRSALGKLFEKLGLRDYIYDFSSSVERWKYELVSTNFTKFFEGSAGAFTLHHRHNLETPLRRYEFMQERVWPVTGAVSRPLCTPSKNFLWLVTESG